MKPVDTSVRYRVCDKVYDQLRRSQLWQARQLQGQLRGLEWTQLRNQVRHQMIGDLRETS